MQQPTSSFWNRHAVLVTMHGKQSMIDPVLRERMGIILETIHTIDTDQFGTFTGEIKRQDTQVRTAIAKARAGITATRCEIGLASEGSFHPHPDVPWLIINREVVVLVDQRNNWILEGWASSIDTSAVQQIVHSIDEATAFAQQVGFPAQGLVARLRASDSRHITKGIRTQAELIDVVASLLRRQRTGILLETDLRAHLNPKRQIVIRQAAENLAANALRGCPQCHAPGVRVIEDVAGLPCKWCGSPTPLRKAEIYACPRCEYRMVHDYPDGTQTASPEHCSLCNP